MKRFLILVAALTAASSLLTACSSGAGTDLQSSETFATTITEPGVVVLDVRTPSEFAAGHIAGAINIDIEDASFSQKISSLDKSTHYAIYCRSGRRSALATTQMKESGFTTLSELDGGLLSWNGPLVTN